MIEASALIVGCARDIGQHAAGGLHNLLQLGNMFREVQYLVVESDSRDNTREILSDAAGSIRGFQTIGMGTLHKRYPRRTERLAICRNAYIEAARDRHAEKDLMIVCDMDGVLGGFSDFGQFELASEMAISAGSDVAFFPNSRPRYYDIWGLRAIGWCDEDCFEHKERLLKSGITEKEASYIAINSRQLAIHMSSSPIEVLSAFGGMGIYPMSYAKEARYIGVTKCGKEVCEHVSFNVMMSVRFGVRHFVLPWLTVKAPLEHLGLIEGAG